MHIFTCGSCRSRHIFCTFCKMIYLVIFLFPLTKVFGNLNPLVVSTFPMQNCTCVPYFQCSDETGKLIIDGDGLLDGRQLENSPCTGYYDVCCNVTASDVIITTPKPYKPSGCGFKSEKDAFPWSLKVLYQTQYQNELNYKCRASLIHPKVAVTAAHCINNKNYLWAVKIGQLLVKVQKKILHQFYHPGTLQNDIALLILKQRIEKHTICLPPPAMVLENSNCSTVIWNEDAKDKTSGSDYEIVSQSLVPKVKCVNELKKTRLGPFFQLHSSFLCAGGNGYRDTCDGDGGAPLICPINGQPGRFHQVGIVSWGIGCGENNVPSVYVNLGLFRDWIDKQLIANGLDIISYRY